MIYSAIAATLADMRQHASSMAQLRMLDRITWHLATTLADYKSFNEQTFLEKAKYGWDTTPSQLEEQ